MDAGRARFLSDLEKIVAASHDRVASLREIARLIRGYGGYRWVGLYDVDSKAGAVRNVVWSGPEAPEYPTFPIGKGLTGTAIAERRVVNVGDVSGDPRYLTALGTTRSEIIVPIFDSAKSAVVGTIDVESELPNVFNEETEALVQACAEMIRPLWNI
jgi:L-methionine (R)-S-oxide reductase